MLALSAVGYPKDEIAVIVGVTPETVKAQKASLLKRLGARNMAHAVALALATDVLPVKDVARLDEAVRRDELVVDKDVLPRHERRRADAAPEETAPARPTPKPVAPARRAKRVPVDPVKQLSLIEARVLELHQEGLGSDELAATLEAPPALVNLIESRVMAKLGVNDLASAISEARERGWLQSV